MSNKPIPKDVDPSLLNYVREASKNYIKRDDAGRFIADKSGRKHGSSLPPSRHKPGSRWSR